MIGRCALLILAALIAVGCGADPTSPLADTGSQDLSGEDTAAVDVEDATRVDLSGDIADSGTGAGDTRPDAPPDVQDTTTPPQDTTAPPKDTAPAPQDTAPDTDTIQVVPLRDDAAPDVGRYAQAEAVSERGALGVAFAAQGYTPPAGAYVLVGRVVDGVDSPAVIWSSYGDTAFTYSPGNYWPASTIKLAAAVAALRTLGQYGLSAQAQISFTDDDGSYSGSVQTLISDALSVSSNVAYNRLMEIAGFEETNEGLLVADEGYPQMVLQRRYTHPTAGSNLRTSPTIQYSEGGASGTIPQRVGTSTYPACTNEANCITLFELLDILRRVTLHDELPAASRFSISDADQGVIMTALNASPTAMRTGAEAALGGSVTIYNKTGHVPGDDRLDHGLIIDDTTGQRYLLAASLPYDTTSDADLETLVEEALRANRTSAPENPPLQRNAGVAVVVQLDDLGLEPGTGFRLVRLTLEAPGADAMTVWADRWSLPASTPAPEPGRFVIEHPFSGLGTRQLVVVATCQGAPCGYRILSVEIPGA